MQRHFSSSESLERECEEILNGTLKAAEETSLVSQVTAEQLQGQTETLQSIQQQSTDISHNLDSSEYILDGMKSWWSSFTQLFTSPPSHPPSSASVATGATCSTGRSSSDVPFSHARQTYNSDTFSNTYSSLLHSVPTGRPPGGRQPSLDSQLNEGLGQLSTILDGIHSQALEMNSQINYQNQMLEDIHSSVDDNDARMVKQRRDMQLLMNR